MKSPKAPKSLQQIIAMFKIILTPFLEKYSKFDVKITEYKGF